MLDTNDHMVYVLHKKFTRLEMTKGNTQIGYGYIEETKDGIIYHYKNDQYRGKAIYDDKQESLILHLDGLKIYLKQTLTGCLIRYENQMIVIQENQESYICESEIKPLYLSICFLFFMMMKEKDELIMMQNRSIKGKPDWSFCLCTVWKMEKNLK